MKKYKIYLRSKPGFYAQYSGALTVVANDEEQAIERAFLRLKTGAFPDRDRSMWIIEKIIFQGVLQ